MACEICELISGRKKGYVLFEDSEMIAYLSDTPAVQGHIILTSKEHFPIIELVPDKLFSKLMTAANKLSILAFERVQAHGTNILINNGISAGQEKEHFLINILPRKQGDGLNVEWTPRKLSEDEMSTAALIINEAQKEKKKEVVEIKSDPVEKIAANKDEKGKEQYSYLVKQLDRMP